MRRSKLTCVYSFTENGLRLRRISMMEFVFTLKEFFGKFYPDRLTLVALPSYNRGTVAIDCEALAIFIKILFSEICGDTPLKVAIDTDQNLARMELSAGETFLERLLESPEIMAMANQSGFRVTYTECGIMLYAPLDYETQYFIHAIDGNDFYSIMKNVFARR